MLQQLCDNLALGTVVLLPHSPVDQLERVLVEVVDELLYIGSLSFVTWYLDNII